VPGSRTQAVWRASSAMVVDADEIARHGERREYFIGTILVSPTTQNNHFEVIDGQQRLTTFFLLLCAIRQRFKGDPQYPLFSLLLQTSYVDGTGNLKTSLKLDPRYEYASELMRRIVEIDADADTTRTRIAAASLPSFGSLENLLNAYRVVHAYLDGNYADLAKLRSYWGYLANNVVFIQISTDVSSALKIFETINERGIGLNSMDLLKNLLFTQVRPDEFTRLKDEWKKVTGPLERSREKPLRFLRYFLMANYKIRNARRDGVVREDEIYDWLIDRENVSLCRYKEDPFRFVRQIIRSVDFFIGYTQGRGNDGQPNLAITTMQQLCGAAFSLHYVLLMAASPLPKPLFDYLVRQLESFLFFYIFTRTPTKDLERNFSAWADELREIAGLTDAYEQKARLNAFVAERFQKSMGEKNAELGDSLRRYGLGSMQQYRTRYFLAKLTQFVEMSFKGMTAPRPLGDYTPLEIEHILPNTPEPDLRAAFAASNPGKDYDDYKNRLGNLTLLEKPINIVASNGFFAEKTAEYAKCGNYLTRSLAGLQDVGKNSTITRINEKLASFEQWGAAEIDRRQDMLIKLAGEVWRTEPIEMN
jgi:hypothetical protein